MTRVRLNVRLTRQPIPAGNETGQHRCGAHPRAAKAYVRTLLLLQLSGVDMELPTAPARMTVEETAHLAAAEYLMKHLGDTALVVITYDDSHRPIAVITASDISKAVMDGRSLEYTRVSDVGLSSH